MNISIKWIRRLKWILIFALSMPIGIVVTTIFDFRFYNWEYWAITLPIQYLLNGCIEKFIDYLYIQRRTRKLHFKEFISDKKAGERF